MIHDPMNMAAKITQRIDAVFPNGATADALRAAASAGLHRWFVRVFS